MKDLYFLFVFMVLISNKGRDVDETRRDVSSFCFVYSYKIYNRVLITKIALGKLLESTLDESSKLKNMSDELTLKSEFLPGNVRSFENSHPARWLPQFVDISISVHTTIYIPLIVEKTRPSIKIAMS